MLTPLKASWILEKSLGIWYIIQILLKTLFNTSYGYNTGIKSFIIKLIFAKLYG